MMIIIIIIIIIKIKNEILISNNETELA